MSSLLEEAIVDAKALKEAALKNAENTVLEKYSAEVRGALNTLLEQEELGLGGLPTGEDDAESADTSFLEGVPYSFQNEEVDAPPGDELIEIDFDELKTRIDEEEAEGSEAIGADLTDALGMADTLQEDGYITKTDLDNDSKEDVASIDADEDEDINLTEEMIDDLIEELVVDMTPRPQGWASMNSADNSILQANNDAMGAAQAAHLEEEEIEEEVETAPDVVSDAELYEAKISQLKESTRELRALLMMSKEQLTKLNLDNAKLVYQNKALSSASLNERQKNQIVEAVQSANSVEETSMIYETIQNAVGGPADPRIRPQTLREAVQRPTSLLISSKKDNTVTKDPAMGRMLRLAGLNK
jgi:LmbE family N-acetylglucosaminyl deacetylase